MSAEFDDPQVINASLLRPNDLVALNYTTPEQKTAGYFFKVEEISLREAGINVGAPRQVLRGRFHGEDLPSELLNEKFEFGGSSDGTFIQWGVLINGTVPQFRSPRGQLLSPLIDKYNIYRPDVSGEMRPVPLNDLIKEAQKVSVLHEARVAKVEELLSIIGFYVDFKDCSQADDSKLEYENPRYLAQYHSGMATGNRLALYDKDTSQWMEFGYFDFQGEGVLKAAFANLEGLDFDKVFIGRYVLGESSILHADVPVITYNTSTNLGLDVINYRPGDEELGNIGIEDYDNSKYRFKGKPSPDIQVFPDGSIVVDAHGFFVPIETTHPGALERINEAMCATTDGKGKMEVRFNGRRINGINPDEELDKLIHSFKQPKDQGLEKVTLLDSLKKHLGNHRLHIPWFK